MSQGGWGYWGSWGKSILSTATATVATVGTYNPNLFVLNTLHCLWLTFYLLACWIVVNAHNLFSCSPIHSCPFRPRAHSGHREGRDIAGNPKSDRTLCASWARAERARWVGLKSQQPSYHFSILLICNSVSCIWPPAGEGSSDTDKAAADGSAAVGSAMGMLTSLTSVVQSTVSRNSIEIHLSKALFSQLFLLSVTAVGAVTHILSGRQPLIGRPSDHSLYRVPV